MVHKKAANSTKSPHKHESHPSTAPTNTQGLPTHTWHTRVRGAWRTLDEAIFVEVYLALEEACRRSVPDGKEERGDREVRHSVVRLVDDLDAWGVGMHQSVQHVGEQLQQQRAWQRK